MNVLIVGGGISGVSAAKVVIKAGHRATIVEAAPEPGGLMARIANCRIGFGTFYDEIRRDPALTLITGATVAAVSRRPGRFTVALDDGRTLPFDSVIVAAGLSPYEPVDYKGPGVLTSLEYDGLIDQRSAELPVRFEKVAFMLCVGSRSADYPLCSSVCCSYTMRQIKWTLQRANPEITVFYNDLRLFGQEFLMERMYRQGGVRFVRAASRYFEPEDGGVRVRYFAGGRINEALFDYVVLATGLRPSPALPALARTFGFSLNDLGFVRERGPLETDVAGIYACGGALEPMGIKDAILTGFGAAAAALGRTGPDERLYMERAPETESGDEPSRSCLFYLGTDDPRATLFYELASSRFIAAARAMKRAGRTVHIVDRNVSTPSYEELTYEEARREGVVFIHLEEGEDFTVEEERARISGPARQLSLPAGRLVRLDDYVRPFIDREFLSAARSEPQLRWSPTKWGRRRYHAGFIRHPRAERWVGREVLAALGEMLLDGEEGRALPEVDEERCSGCGACRSACPHGAIEVEAKQAPVAVFGRAAETAAPVARVKGDVCVGCGLCISTCPADVIK